MKGFRDSYFAKTLGLMKGNPKNMINIVLFDFLFLATASIFYWLVGFLFVGAKTASAIMIIVYLILTLLYYLILVLICSFFKYLVLNSLKGLFNKTKINFKKLKKFYLLNLLIFAVAFMAFLALNGTFLIGVKEEYAAYAFLVISVPLFLIVYIFLNISHTLFSETEKPKIKEISKKTFELILKLKTYLGIFLTNLVLVAAYFIIFNIIGIILKATVFKSYLMPAEYYNVYTIAFGVIMTLFFYFIFFFNRIYFYNIIKNLPSKK